MEDCTDKKDHPLFPSSDWRTEFTLGYTREGYWDWVEHQLEMLEAAEAMLKVKLEE